MNEKFAWESGAITLPASEFRKAHRQVVEAERRFQKKAADTAKKYWGSLTSAERTGQKAYYTALERHKATLDMGKPGPGDEHPLQSEQAAVDERALEFLAMAGPTAMRSSMLELPNSKTDVLPYSWGEIRFDKDSSSIRWEAKGGGDNVEAAKKSAIGQEFLRAVRKVRWTPDTGGIITYDSGYRRGQGPGVSRAFGPIGAATAPAYCEPYFEKSGKAMTSGMLTEREIHRSTGDRFTRLKGAADQPRGHNGHSGQYTFKAHGVPEVELDEP